MSRCGVVRAMVAVLIGCASAAAGDAPAAEPRHAPVVILKLDDVTHGGARADQPISARWQRCVDFLEREQVKATFGIIGDSLERDVEPYFTWIKSLHAKGNIEFWNHGYGNKPDQFKGRSADEQAADLQKTQRLAKEKLGITLKAFGAHWSTSDAATTQALETCPEITMWFLSGPNLPTAGSTKVLMERAMNMEHPTFVPNLDKMQESYEKFGHAKPYIVLQGHPAQWDDQRFDSFVKCIQYLREQGCQFMTVSEYVAQANAK